MALPFVDGPDSPTATPLPERRTLRTQPLVLIGERHEWMARSLASVITPRGYDIFHAFTADDIVLETRQRRPDVIVLGARLPGKDCVQICRDLRLIGETGPVTPIVVLTSLQVSQSERLEFLEAGAWDCIRFPEQVPELLMKIQTFAHAKVTAELGLREALLDGETGLYNFRGLLRRARDESAEAWRYSTPLACVTLAPDEASEGRILNNEELLAEFIRRTSEILRSETRSSDVLARLDRIRFGLLAPSTGGAGAAILARRIVETLDTAFATEPLLEGEPVTFQAGCYGVQDIRKEGLDAEKIIRRTHTALKRARAHGPSRRVEPYDQGRLVS
jgi:PleD family two-component response regulator